jgi:hypothetical protein
MRAICVLRQGGAIYIYIYMYVCMYVCMYMCATCVLWQGVEGKLCLQIHWMH